MIYLSILLIESQQNSNSNTGDLLLCCSTVVV